MVGVYTPVRTREDIVERQTVRMPDNDNGQERYRIICGPSASDMDTFGKVKCPTWTYKRRAVEPETAFETMALGESWSGAPTWEVAINYARYGWPEGSKRAKDIVNRLSVKLPHAMKHKYHPRPSVAPVGTFTLNIPSVVQGRPDQFIGRFKSREMTQGRKIIRVAVNIVSSGCVGLEQLMNRGACIMALMDTLKRLGFGVDLTVFDTSSCSDMLVMQEWHVAPAGKHINPDVVAYALINPSAGRRLLFAMLENAPHAGRYHGGYGGMFHMREEFKDRAKDFDIVIESGLVSDNPQHWVSDESMLNWIKMQLSEQGINIDDTTFAR